MRRTAAEGRANILDFLKNLPAAEDVRGDGATGGSFDWKIHFEAGAGPFYNSSESLESGRPSNAVDAQLAKTPKSPETDKKTSLS